MSILNSLGAAAAVTFGGTVGAYAGGSLYMKAVGVSIDKGVVSGDIEKVNMTHGIASVMGGALVGAFVGAWAHSALTDTTVSVPTIAGGITVSPVDGMTPPAVV